MSNATKKLYRHSMDGQGKNFLRNWLVDLVSANPTASEANQLKLIDGAAERLVIFLTNAALAETVAWRSDIGKVVALSNNATPQAGVVSIQSDTDTHTAPALTSGQSATVLRFNNTGNLTGETHYVHDGTGLRVWAVNAAAPGELDGNTVFVVRSDATAAVAPTAAEAPTPVAGKTAIVFLNNGVKEYWSFGTAWTLTRTENPNTAVSAAQFIGRTGNIDGVSGYNFTTTVNTLGATNNGVAGIALPVGNYRISLTGQKAINAGEHRATIFNRAGQTLGEIYTTTDRTDSASFDYQVTDANDFIRVTRAFSSGNGNIDNAVITITRADGPFVVSAGTEIRTPVILTANNGNITVNGSTTSTLFAGTSARVMVAVPAGQLIDSVTGSAGLTVSVADARTGALEIAVADGATGAVSVTVAFANALDFDTVERDSGMRDGGNIVYKRTFNGNTPNNTSDNLLFTITGATEIIKYEGVLRQTNGRRVNVDAAYSGNAAHGPLFQIYPSGSNMEGRVWNATSDTRWQGMPYRITVWYTK